MMKLELIMVSVLSSIIFTSAYASSIAFSADSYVMSCSYTKDKKTSFCSDNDPTNNDVWRCDKQKNGTWKCGKIPRESGPSLPGDLKNALDKAQLGIGGETLKGGNETTSSGLKDKISKGENFLKGGQTLKDTQNSVPDNNANGNATIQ